MGDYLQCKLYENYSLRSTRKQQISVQITCKQNTIPGEKIESNDELRVAK